MDKDPYKILGVSKDASQSEIKKEYRVKAKKYHPDVSKNNKEHEEKFKEISEAYAILSDPDKKMQYDRFGTIGNQPQQNNHHWKAFRDFFNGQFNEPMQRQRKTVNPEVRSSLKISLSSAIFGCTKTHKIRRAIACDSCQTTGVSMDSNDRAICSSCNGQGKRIVNTPTSQFINICGVCGGSGETFKECKKCKGASYFFKNEIVKIKIPKNLKRNSSIRLKDKGNTIYQSNGEKYTGSHYLIIDYPLSDRGITLNGSNINVIIQASIDQILAEDEITIKLFDKKNIQLKLNSTQDYNKHYIINVDFLNGGSVFVKVLPKIPSKDISEENKVLLVKALREAYGKSESIISPTINWT